MVEVINILEEPDVSTLTVKNRDIKLLQNASMNINNNIQTTKPEFKVNTTSYHQVPAKPAWLMRKIDPTLCLPGI